MSEQTEMNEGEIDQETQDLDQLTLEGPPEPEAAPPPRPRGRPKGSKKKTSQDPDMSVEDAERYDYDSWIDRWEWSEPGMKCKVERKSPQSHPGPNGQRVSVAGALGTFENKGMTEDEIRREFGGGTFDISVIGFRDTKKGPRNMRLSHKALVIPGNPRTDNLGIGEDAYAAESAPTGRRSGASENSDPWAKIVDTSVSQLHQRADIQSKQSAQTVQAVSQQFHEAANMKVQAADKLIQDTQRLAREQVESAQRRVEEIREQAEQARKEKDQALAAVHEANERILRERQVMEVELSKRLQTVHGDSNNLISTLLPQAQQQAQQQINMMMTMFESRLTSAESSYQSRLDNLDVSYSQRLAAQADLFKSQMESAKQLSHGRIQHLELELQSARAEKTLVAGQLEEVRNRLMEEISKMNKSQDPEQQMVKLGSLMETVKAMTGFGGGEEKDTTTGNAIIDAISSNIGKISEIVPHVTQAMTAKANADAFTAQAAMRQPPQQMQQVQQQRPQQQMQQLQAPQQMQQMQRPQQQPQRPQQRQAPRRQAPRQAPPKQAGGKIKREDLDNAMVYINAALTSTPDLNVESFASMVKGSVPNDMLKILSTPNPEDVVNDLEQKGVLHGVVSTDKGKSFLLDLLVHLKKTM